MGCLLSCFNTNKNNSNSDEIISSPPQQNYQTNTYIRTERRDQNERPYEHRSVYSGTLQNQRNLRNLEEQNKRYTNAVLAPVPSCSREINSEEDNSDSDEIISSPPQRKYQTNTHIVRTERSVYSGTLQNQRNLRNLEEQNKRYRNAVLAPVPRYSHEINSEEDNSDSDEIISSPPQRKYQTNTHIVRTERSVWSGTLHNQRNLRNLEELYPTYTDAFLAPVPRYSSEINTDLPAGCKKLSPSAIHYTQDSIATTFYERGRHAGVKLGQTLDDLLSNRIQIKDIPQITVCWYKQQWFSLDNRRLWVLKNYEKIKGNVQIIVRVTAFMDEGKLTTLNNGKSIRVRGDPGGSYWKTFKFNRYQ